MAKYAKEAERAVKKCYPTLLKLLPISELADHFYSRELLSNSRKSKLDSFITADEKVRYFLDEMLIPSLEIDYTGYFDEMISMMKESDDILTRRLVEKLMADVSASASTDTSSITSTTDTGIE